MMHILAHKARNFGQKKGFTVRSIDLYEGPQFLSKIKDAFLKVSSLLSAFHITMASFSDSFLEIGMKEEVID